MPVSKNLDAPAKSDSSGSADSAHVGSSDDASQRIDQLNALASFLHADIEKYKSAVARELHDDLGGSVIAAMMDVSWIEMHETALSADTLMRLTRIKEGLRGAIDLARKLVEDLRPTLLDTMGLFAALSWQLKRGCARAGLKYKESYPDSIPQLNTHALVTLFRIAQESFSLLLQHPGITSLSLVVSTTPTAFVLQFTGDGKAGVADSCGGIASSISHRIRQFGGRLAIVPLSTGVGSIVRAELPLNDATRAPYESDYDRVEINGTP
jgi:signal transduction histidine kinase